MDYKKLSNESLDNIMNKIMDFHGMIDKKELKNQTSNEAVIFEAQTSSTSQYINQIKDIIERCRIGEQIGMRKASMSNTSLFFRPIAKLIEKVYLRVAELTNRDVRIFNRNILNIFQLFEKCFIDYEQRFHSQESLLERLTQDYEQRFHSQESVLEKLMQDNEQRFQLLDSLIEKLSRDYLQIHQQFESYKLSISSSLDWLNRDYCAQIESSKVELQKYYQQEIDKAANNNAAFVEKIAYLEMRLRDISESLAATKAIVKWANNEEFNKEIKLKSERPTLELSTFYHDFEERFRGSQADIKERLNVYLPMILNHFNSLENKRIIDVGCGRGELLDLFKEHGANDYIGIDLNNIQLNICKNKGHRVLNADAIEYIKTQPDASVNIITGIQVIEHFSFGILLAFLNECRRVLKSGGMILFETPNPSNIITASTYFFMDPTHVRPIHKDLARFIVERTGFKNVDVIEANSAKFVKTLMTPLCLDGNQALWKENIDTLNCLMYGPQDYAVVGIKE